jgi:predicted anti-sigma-YlaC factor YlaD
MRCGTIREALSARLDGENPGLPDDDIDAHLGGCESCRAWALAAGALARVVERAPRDQVALDPALLASLTARRTRPRPACCARGSGGSSWRSSRSCR